MKKILSVLLLSCCLSFTVAAQGTGTWQSHLSYHNTTAVAETNEYVFALANNSLYSYNKTDNSLKFYSTLNGLSDTFISQIGYNTEVNKLVITYTNGNIDLFQPDNGSVKNLPFLKQDITIQDPTVNSVYMYKEYAYLSTAFGIVVVNLKKEEITDTYKLQTGVYSTYINGNTIYAATKDKGVLQASLTANLLDYHSWETYPMAISTTDTVKDICFFSGMFAFYLNSTANNGVYYRQADGSIQSIKKDATLKGVTIQNGKLIAYGSTCALIMSSFTESFSIHNSPVNGISSLKDPNIFWIASGDAGLKGVRTNGNTAELIVSDLATDSPIRNLDAYMTFHNNKLLVAGGSRWNERGEKPGTLMTYENGEWYNFDQAAIIKASGVQFKDVTCVAVDPTDENHYYASTWGEGVFECKDNQFVTLYNHKNSSLQSVYPGEKSENNYIRVEGLCFDKNNNLWMTNSSVSTGIKVLKADGTWSSLSGTKYTQLNGIDLIDKILITSKNNHKWVNILRKSSFIFVFDDNGTIDDTSDDRVKKIETFVQSSATINASAYNCMVEDQKNNTIWIGTNIGPLICLNPDKVFDSADTYFTAYRPIREGEDGLAGYLLQGENIQAIAVDGGNRKWLGTQSAGIFVVSEDGSETIEHFSTDNAPLPSNNVNSLAINPLTGEVFVGTDKGMVSYMSGATEGGETYSDVYAYPNPVRPEHNDQVTITGLMNDSNVKITDLNGNLIYQAKSVGGQLTWNCRKKNGERVATGIYLVLASQPDRGESVVTKIMVIK